MCSSPYERRSPRPFRGGPPTLRTLRRLCAVLAIYHATPPPARPSQIRVHIVHRRTDQEGDRGTQRPVAGDVGLVVQKGQRAVHGTVSTHWAIWAMYFRMAYCLACSRRPAVVVPVNQRIGSRNTVGDWHPRYWTYAGTATPVTAHHVVGLLCNPLPRNLTVHAVHAAQQKAVDKHAMEN